MLVLLGAQFVALLFGKIYLSKFIGGLYFESKDEKYDDAFKPTETNKNTGLGAIVMGMAKTNSVLKVMPAEDDPVDKEISKV